MQEIIAQLVETQNRLKARKAQLSTANVTNIQKDIDEYEKAIVALKKVL